MPIRILVVDLPRMQREIVCSLLAQQNDMELVDGTHDDSGLSRLIRETGADVLVNAGTEPDLRGSASRLLQEHPRLKIVTLTRDGRTAYRIELRPRVAKISEVSPLGLVEAIRSAAGSRFSVAGVDEAH